MMYICFYRQYDVSLPINENATLKELLSLYPDWLTSESDFTVYRGHLIFRKSRVFVAHAMGVRPLEVSGCVGAEGVLAAIDEIMRLAAKVHTIDFEI